MLSAIKNVIVDEDGATMVEYGLIVALIAAVAIGVVTTLGGNVKDTFNQVAGAVHPAQ